MRKFRLKAALGLLILPSVCGCARYDTVSPQAYEYSKALYSVCNRQDEPRLLTVADQIETAAAESQLTGQEVNWLSSIVSTAQSGDWQDATKDARRLMEAQVVGR